MTELGVCPETLGLLFFVLQGPSLSGLLPLLPHWLLRGRRPPLGRHFASLSIFFFFQPVRTLQGLQSWGQGRPPGSRKPLLRRAYFCFLNLAKFPLTTTAVALSTWTAASFPLNCGHAAWPSLVQLSETPPVLTQLLLLSCYQLNPRTALRNKQGARKWMSQPVMSMGT